MDAALQQVGGFIGFLQQAGGLRGTLRSIQSCRSGPGAMLGHWQVEASIHKMPENTHMTRHFGVSIDHSGFEEIFDGDHSGVLKDFSVCEIDRSVTADVVFDDEPMVTYHMKGHFEQNTCNTVVIHENGAKACGMATWKWTRVAKKVDYL